MCVEVVLKLTNSFDGYHLDDSNILISLLKDNEKM